MVVINDMIQMEMSKMGKVTDRHMDEWRTMVNRPRHKQTWSKASKKIFKMAAMAAILDIVTKGISNSESSCHPDPPTKFWFNLTNHSGTDESWRFSRWPPLGPSRISDQKFLTILNLYVTAMPPIKIWAQHALRFGRRCLLNYFKMAPVADILEAVRGGVLNLGERHKTQKWRRIQTVVQTSFS